LLLLLFHLHPTTLHHPPARPPPSAPLLQPANPALLPRGRTKTPRILRVDLAPPRPGSTRAGAVRVGIACEAHWSG
ncbi:Os04g0675000, partial [Oryza sativa Japonica Group]